MTEREKFFFTAECRVKGEQGNLILMKMTKWWIQLLKINLGYSCSAFAFFQPTSLNVQCAFRQPDDMRFSVYLINHIPNPPAGGKQQSIAMSGQLFACWHIFINFWSRFHSFLSLCVIVGKCVMGWSWNEMFVEWMLWKFLMNVAFVNLLHLKKYSIIVCIWVLLF